MAATGIDRLIQWKKDNPTRAKEASRRWEKAHPQRFQQLLAWKKAHPQRTLQMRRNYHETHKEQDNEKVRAWRKTHQERVRELSARWQREHPERSRELARLRGRRYIRAHPELRSIRVEKHRQWLAAHPEKSTEYRLRYPWVPGLKWLLKQRPELKPICTIGGGLATHADHIRPVSRGGSIRDPMNLRPLCARHNIMRGPARMTDRELRAFPCANRGDIP